jgi:AcrR family transcriptional regulator
MAEIDAAKIAAAGLVVADERGAGGLTMRAVADTLDVSAMALYHYVDDKAGLVALMVEAAIGEQPLPAPTGSGWKEDVWAVASWMRDGMRRHPAVARLRQDFNVWSPSILAIGERWMNLWQQSGLDFDDAVTAAMTSLLGVNGIVAQEASLPSFELPGDGTLDLLPNVRAALTASRDFDASFELFVRSMVDGVHSRLAGSEHR